MEDIQLKRSISFKFGKFGKTGKTGITWKTHKQNFTCCAGPVPTSVGAADRPRETLYTKKNILKVTIFFKTQACKIIKKLNFFIKSYH